MSKNNNPLSVIDPTWSAAAHALLTDILAADEDAIEALKELGIEPENPLLTARIRDLLAEYKTS